MLFYNWRFCKAPLNSSCCAPDGEFVTMFIEGIGHLFYFIFRHNEKISRSAAIGCIDFVMHHLFFKYSSITCLCLAT